MTVRIALSYTKGIFRIDGRDVPKATLMAAYLLKENGHIQESLDLLGTQRFHEIDARQLLLAMDDSKFGVLRDYTVEDEAFANIFKKEGEPEVQPEPAAADPSIFVTVKGGAVCSIEATTPRLFVQVSDLDTDEGRTTNEDKPTGLINVW